MAKYHSTKICPCCKEPFKSNNPNRKHCSLACRFWSKVNIGDPEDCWEWRTYRTPDGYGKFWVDYERWFQPSHRIVWELEYGGIPNGLMVLHDCDNPPCCNLNHLFLGTQVENMADMVKKHRSPKNSVGESNVKAKLTGGQVSKIRQAIEEGTSYNDLIAEYHVSRSTISSIKCGITWTHI